PGRHGGRVAVEHRLAEALEIVLGKFAQVEGDAAGIDHVAAVAADAEFVVDVVPELGVVRTRAGAQGAPKRERREDPAPHGFTIRRAQGTPHAHTFFCRSAAIWIGGSPRLSAPAPPPGA